MKPDDFLVLATRLSASHGEAEQRSAISRAYYGVFHAARLLIDACDIQCPESGEAHDKVAKCLQNSQDQDLIAAGNKLNSLRTMRNHADYRLSDGRFTNPKFVAIQLAIAREIADALSAAQARLPSIREPIRQFAKQTLKLIVRG